MNVRVVIDDENMLKIQQQKVAKVLFVIDRGIAAKCSQFVGRAIIEAAKEIMENDCNSEKQQFTMVDAVFLGNKDEYKLVSKGDDHSEFEEQIKQNISQIVAGPNED
jgi:hypothetical protein